MRTPIYKFKQAAVITDFIELPGEVISNDVIDLKNPPVIPDHLHALFSAISKGDVQTARMITCHLGPSSHHTSQNGWSMCQSQPPRKRRLGDTVKTETFLAPV